MLCALNRAALPFAAYVNFSAKGILLMAYRTFNCGELSLDDLGKRVTLAGWVDTIRDHGGVAFIDLRDEYGVTQVVVNDDTLIYHLKKRALFPLRALL